MIVATAGHVDHGKSSLVEALTGSAVDRLAEEQRRGLTISLGFAPLTLPDGRVIGLVDVPGHEDLVRTMAAGVSGSSAALLVVAADEGIMPQTEEHLLILEQLGVRHGVVAVSKMDRVSAADSTRVSAEIVRRLAASAVCFGAPVRTSVVRRQGLDALRQALASLPAGASDESRQDLFRLPIDRVFSAPGVGTVVTGSSWTGTIAEGDDVVVLPQGMTGVVRSIEEFGARQARTTPGRRTALALRGIRPAEIARGSVVVEPGAGWRSSRQLDVLVQLTCPAPARRLRVLLLHATAAVPGWLSMRKDLAPASAAMTAHLTLDRPVVARGGDRFVLRRLSPSETLGGGQVLDPFPGRQRGSLKPSRMDPDFLHALLLRRRGVIDRNDLPVLTGLPPARLAHQLAGDERLIGFGGSLCSRHAVETCASGLRSRLADWHRDRPDTPGISLATLRHGAPGQSILVEAALQSLVTSGEVQIMSGLAHLAGFEPALPAAMEAIAALIAVLKEGGLAPAMPDELAQRIGRPLPEVLEALRVASRLGLVVAVAPDRFCVPVALARFSDALRDLGATGPISVGAVREKTGLSRKFLIPLLEWADRAGVTDRHGDLRHLRRAGSRGDAARDAKPA